MAKTEAAEQRADLAAQVGARIEYKVDALIRIVGEEHEDERGYRVGTGVVGRLMRLEESAEVLAPASGFSVNLAFIGNHLVTSSAGI
jgi:hypothetical protein